MVSLEGTTHSSHAMTKLWEKQFILSPEISPTSTRKSPPRRYHGVLDDHTILSGSPMPNLKAPSVAAKYSHTLARKDTLQCWAWGRGRVRESPVTKTSEAGLSQLQVVLPGSCGQFRLSAVSSSMPPSKTPTSLRRGYNSTYPGRVLSTVPGMLPMLSND